MDFTFSEEQLLAAQALRGLLADHCRGSDLRRAAEARTLADFLKVCAPRRARLQELGLDGALVGSGQGGLGLEPVDFVLLAEEAGRAALPEPLVGAAGVAHPLLAALVEGSRGSGREVAAEVLRAAIAGSVTVLALPYGEDIAAAAPYADWFLLCRSPEELVLLRAADFAIRPLESVDPLRRLGQLLAHTAAPHAVLHGAPAAAARAAAQLRATTFDAAQLLGLAARMAELAVAYALERKQFGKAIGSNQAVKHQLADVMVKLEFARPVVYAAAATLAPLRVAHAAIAAIDAADRAARTAIQVHGAMGYSWEVDLQFYAKRAWALAGLNGGRSRHAAAIHRALQEGRCELGPDRLFAQPDAPPATEVARV